MEFWDLYDKNRKPLGKQHERGRALQEGEFHIGVSIWTVNTEGKILITRRDPEKDSYPGYWENTGGSLLVGEDPLTGAVRELREETGIIASTDELTYLGSVIGTSIIMDIFGLGRDVPLSEIIFQKGETVDARWVSFEEFAMMCQAEEIAPPIGKRFLELRKELREFADACRTDLYNVSEREKKYAESERRPEDRQL